MEGFKTLNLNVQPSKLDNYIANERLSSLLNFEKLK